MGLLNPNLLLPWKKKKEQQGTCNGAGRHNPVPIFGQVSQISVLKKRNFFK
jgi:hypothetical protein